tara:strand:+ start:2004 stop:2168 length:165 start_codon:yes stop_codon:yes gene_type:complete
MKQKVTTFQNQSWVDIFASVQDLTDAGAEIVQVVKHGNSLGSETRADYIVIYKE